MPQEYLNQINKQLIDQQFANTKKFKFMIFFVMLSMTIVLCKGIFSYRLVEIHGHTIQAGQLIAPLWFLISDMIAEIYGYSIAKQSILAGFLCQTLFTFACLTLNSLPFPLSSWHEFDAYQTVFKDLWRVNLAVLVAFILSGFINIQLITHWQILLRGKHFWIRSIGASGISELLFSFLATFIIQYGKQDLHFILNMIFLSCALKILYSIILSIPANILVLFIKKTELLE